MFAPVELTIEIIRLRTPDRFVVNNKNLVTIILLLRTYIQRPLHLNVRQAASFQRSVSAMPVCAGFLQATTGDARFIWLACFIPFLASDGWQSLCRSAISLSIGTYKAMFLLRLGIYGMESRCTGWPNGLLRSNNYLPQFHLTFRKTTTGQYEMFNRNL
jgi:hypothetical protein